MIPSLYSSTRRAILVIFAVSATFTAAGSIYGFAGLKEVFVKEGIYSELCGADEVRPCTAQLLRLALMFSAAALASACFQLPSGVILDAIGPRRSFALASLLFAAGTVLMASSGPVFDGYMPGFILLGVAGLLMYMSVIHISVTFPARAGLLLAMISGAFDASGIVFPAYGWIYDAVGWKPTDFFWTYTSVPILLFCGNFLQPSESFEWASDDVIKVDPPGNTPVEEDLNRSLRKIDSDDTITPSLLASASSSESTPLLTPPPEEPAQGPSHGSAPARLSARDRYIQSLPVTEQLRTPEFFLNATWIFLTTVRINFYIATLAEQLGEMQGPGQEAMKESIVSVFNVANSIGAVAMIVPMGYLIDTYPLYVNFLIQYFVFAFPFAVLGLVPSLPVQYITATLGGLIRPFMYTTTIQFASQTFGFKSFGRVYGLQMFVASLCNFLQYFLSWVALDVMGGQFFWVNVFLSVLQTAVLAFPLYLRRVSIVAAKTEADAS